MVPCPLDVDQLEGSMSGRHPFGWRNGPAQAQLLGCIHKKAECAALLQEASKMDSILDL